MEIEEQVTPELDVEQDGAEGNSEGGEQEEKPFFRVNDRTVYKTEDEARRGFDEAGRTIARLTPWEKEARQWGLDDPKALRTIFNEVLELRELKKGMEKQAAGGGKPQATTSDDQVELTPDEKKALDWLKKSGMKLGYVPKEEVEAKFQELKDVIEELKSGSAQSEEQRFRNQEAEHRSNLGTWLSEAKIQDDAEGTRTRVVGTLIKDWINNDDELVDRWRQGGVEARNLIREGFDLALKSLGWSPVASTQSSSYAADKARSVAGNKKLPAQGTATKKVSEVTRGRKKDAFDDMHERARAEFERVINDRK